MINSGSSSGMSSLSVSPIRGNTKHQITPLKSRKTSRKDQGADVHTTCSTPNRLQSGNPCSNLNSPSDSFPCSQDNRPDVIWDYTSPKLPKGAKKKELKVSVEEFLKSLPHNQGVECNTQGSHYIRLLEKWMSKQNTPVCVQKKIRVRKRDSKVRTRLMYEKMKQFVESIKQEKENEIKENNREESTNENTVLHMEGLNPSSSSVNKKSFLEGENNENDSIEELWGEVDNSFIVKATQQLEMSCLKYNAQDKNTEIISTIPETVPTTSSVPKYTNHEAQPRVEKDGLNKTVSESDYQAQMLLTQIMNYNWDSDSDFEDFENGFIVEDDALSLIPDEVLSGRVLEKKLDEKISQITVEKSRANDKKLKESSNEVNSKKLEASSNGSRRQDSENRSREISFGCSDSVNVAHRVDNMSEIELFNNFEDESFGDESILCKPEVLSWIDEVESQATQSRKNSPELSQGPKCTPEEIEKKKDEAIQRRKRNQIRNRKS